MVKVFEYGSQLPKMQEYKQKPLIISAVQIDEKFLLITEMDTLIGNIGDYIVRDFKNEITVIDQETFEASYEKC